MIVVIELRPLRVNTFSLLYRSNINEFATFETLIQLYFDSQHHSFDIRDLMMDEMSSAADDQLNDIWNDISEFQQLTANYMKYFLGDQVSMMKYREIHGSVLALEYWKSDEIKQRNAYQNDTGHRSITQGVPQLSRGQLAFHR